MMVNKLGLCVSIGLFYSMGFTNEVLWDLGVVINRPEIQNTKDISHPLPSKEKKYQSKTEYSRESAHHTIFTTWRERLSPFLNSKNSVVSILLISFLTQRLWARP